jgi:hypothetical protein
MEPRKKQTTYPEEFKQSTIRLDPESDQPVAQTANYALIMDI